MCWFWNFLLVGLIFSKKCLGVVVGKIRIGGNDLDWGSYRKWVY